MNRILSYLAIALCLLTTACATGAGAWPSPASVFGGHGPLRLTINPAAQSVSRAGAGAISTTVTYSGSGGAPGYTYATSAPGLSVTNGTTTTPSFSTTLTTAQDSTFTVTGTITDSRGHTDQTTSTIEFVAAYPPLALVIAPSPQTVTRDGAGAVSADFILTPSGGVPPYSYATDATGLTVTGGATSTPNVSTTLTNGQDTTFTVTGTLTDSVGSTPAITNAAVDFISIPPPLALIITPQTQTQSRVGAGAISTGVTYAASGGVPPYGYSTVATGLSISGGTTTTPTVSTTLSSSQDTTYTVTGTVTDSVGTTPASTNASVEFIATAPPVGLALSVLPATQIITRSGAGAISTGVAYTASGGSPPYVYSTSAPGLSVSAGTTTAPTVSTTLTNGQDSTFTVTGTVTDSALTVVNTPVSVEFQSIVPPMSLAVAPASSLVTRSGAGSVSQALTYTVTGGKAPYTYATSAPGLTVTSGTTAAPTVSKVLTSGQDSSFTVTGTVTDALSSTANGAASVEFKSIVPPLALVVTPSAQTHSRSGAGSISAGVTYTASGGSGIYTYATSAPGLTVSGGTTTTPTVSTTLSAGQDSSYAVTGTVSDSLGTTPANGSGSVRFTASAPLDPLGPLARGMVADNVAQTLLQAPSSSVAPYTPVPRVLYSNTDYIRMGASGYGFTYFRIPIDVQQILPNLPLPTSYLQVSSGFYSPLTTKFTKTVSTTAPLIGPAGCGDLFIANACFNEYALEYLDTVIAGMVSNGFAVDLVPFVAGTMPTACKDASGTVITCPAGTTNVAGKGLHQIMGTGTNLYGYASFEAMLQAANMVLVNRYHSLYSPAQLYFEPYNEPDYKMSGAVPAPTTSWQNPALWNAAVVSITAAIRGVDTSHWLIIDCPSSAKAQFCQYLTPSGDASPGSIIAFHKYDPVQLVNQTSTTPLNPYVLYPRPGSGDPAIGRPGGVITDYMPFPKPVFGTPSFGSGTGLSSSTVTATAGCADSVPAFVGTPTVAWASSTHVPLAVNSEFVCITGNGSPAVTANVSLYDGSQTPQQSTKSLLLNSTADGVKIALNYAAAGGHDASVYGVTWAATGGGQTTYSMLSDLTGQISPGSSVTIAGTVSIGGTHAGFNGTFTVVSISSSTMVVSQPSASSPGTYKGGGTIVGAGPASGLVQKLIAGEIGSTKEADYLSLLQFFIDIRSVLDSNGVVGGQANIPWDFWAFTGTKFGFRPKAGIPADTKYCLDGPADGTSYDKDYIAIFSTPQTLGSVPNCSGGIYLTPGYN